MQKALLEFVSLPESELTQLIDREPVLVTRNGEPQFVAQSLDAFEAMVRRLRQLESASAQSLKPPRNLVLLRP